MKRKKVSRINFKIIEIVKKHNSDFAFPTSSVFLENQNVKNALSHNPHLKIKLPGRIQQINNGKYFKNKYQSKCYT